MLHALEWKMNTPKSDTSRHAHDRADRSTHHTHTLVCCLFCISLMREKTSVMWIDNYSKTYAAAVQGLSSGAYASCLWMARGIKHYVGQPVDLGAPDLPRGVPLVLFSKKRLKDFEAEMHALDGRVWEFSDSYCSMFDVQCVPPKRIVCAVLEPELAKIVAEHRDGVTNFHPHSVIDSNPAKNTELVRYFREEHYDRMMANPDAPVEVMVCDVNIYYRLMKVIGLAVGALACIARWSWTHTHMHMLCVADFDGRIRCLSQTARQNRSHPGDLAHLQANPCGGVGCRQQEFHAGSV
jgi:hypothetical protein